MAERWQGEAWAREMWWSGKTTRRRFLGLSAGAAGALGAAILVPAPWREAFGRQTVPDRDAPAPVGAAASGANGPGRGPDGGGPDQQERQRQRRAIELLVTDYESKPDVGRRRAEKLVVEDQVDAHAGAYLSNMCLACMPVYEERKVVNMITVCLDTTITRASAAGTRSARSTSRLTGVRRRAAHGCKIGKR